MALCIANPSGPTAVKQCEPPIKKAWKAWAKGKSVPECKKQNQDGTTGGNLRDDGTYIDHMYANPNDPNLCPFAYYAGREKFRYCAFLGVTNQYVDGQLWGRIWYGGPAGVPYIEMLHEDPGNPRPADGFEEAWKLLKDDIESKSDYAAIAYKIWEDAEARAVKVEKAAASAREQANQMANKVAHLESTLPGDIADQTEKYKVAEEAYAAKYPEYQAAKAAAEAPNASPTLIFTFKAIEAETIGLLTQRQKAQDKLQALFQQQASLPELKKKASELDAIALAAEADASEKRSIAITNKAESDAAQEAAKPLPEPFGS